MLSYNERIAGDRHLHRMPKVSEARGCRSLEKSVCQGNARGLCDVQGSRSEMLDMVRDLSYE